jgi:hypothetical protein
LARAPIEWREGKGDRKDGDRLKIGVALFEPPLKPAT